MRGSGGADAAAAAQPLGEWKLQVSGGLVFLLTATSRLSTKVYRRYLLVE